VGGRGARLDGVGMGLGVSWRYHLADCNWVCGGRAIERHPGRALDI
jgi:hypothetical protein